MHDPELKSSDFKPLLVDSDERAELLARFSELPALVLDQRALWDLDFLAIGAYSPLTGFMNQDEYESVLETRRLPDDTVWPIPIMLPCSPEQADALEPGTLVGLTDAQQRPLAVLNVSESFDFNKEREAELVFTTKETGHPGVAELYDRLEIYLAGAVKVLNRPELPGLAFPDRTPASMREHIAARNWKRVVGFRTQALPHAAFEFFLKSALADADGLHLHAQGIAEHGFSQAVRMKAIDALIRAAFSAEQVLTGAHPAKPRYAGPREALLHAIMERNYGCTDVIVHRDYAGAGNFYGTYDAFDIFEDFEQDELGIRPIYQENVLISERTGELFAGRSAKNQEEDAPVPWNERDLLDKLEAGVAPDAAYMRLGVAQVLLENE